MITIAGEYGTAKVYADEVDSGAEGLLRALCASPLSGGSQIRIMPDVHPGKGCAVGTTMTITDRVAPGLVGTDIGCGMEVYRVKGKRLEMQKLDRIVHEKIPSGRRVRTSPHRFADRAAVDALYCSKHVQRDKAYRSIGTLGGGNHFIELSRGEDGAVWVIVHSGSRGLGAEVAGWYKDAAYRQCPEGTPYELAWAEGDLLDQYLHDMAIMQEFAAINRQAIADEIIRGMKFSVEATFSTVHNYIDLEAGILRKGAVSAREGEKLVIPINMRDGSLLCTGKGNADWNNSAPHGAGRRMTRAEAKSSFTVSEYKKLMKDVFSTSVGRDTLDECPMAYKPMDAIVSQIGPTVRIDERLTPIYNYKVGADQI